MWRQLGDRLVIDGCRVKTRSQWLIVEKVKYITVCNITARCRHVTGGKSTELLGLDSGKFTVGRQIIRVAMAGKS